MQAALGIATGALLGRYLTFGEVLYVATISGIILEILRDVSHKR